MPETEPEEETLRARLEEVRRRIDASAGRAGRVPEEVTLIAVSKTHPVALLREAVAAGARVFGENRVQEAEAKIEELSRDADVRWHLIGHLQANKARRAARLFDCIHSVDSVALVERLERLCVEENRERLEILLQIDLAGEATKEGAREDEVPALVASLASCERLRLKGLMTLPPFEEEAERVRPFFRRLRELRDRLRDANAFPEGAGELSMGMSHDFEVAVEEGATLVRVGTAIFGARARVL
ncbi:MAG TPA: YggS family pyridoxal phosphate-dependent enzyme [Pyrinomonadaceae bacterium]|nr:YggS family pyridoxal phosphate-dependent enzyme [Pyrinomonadaceae bacterium]